jgi:transposase
MTDQSLDLIEGQPAKSEVGIYKGININELIDLRKRNLSYQRIADIVGCHKSNVIERLKPFKEAIDGLTQYKSGRADILAVHQQRVLAEITPEKLQKAQINTLLPAFGILYDKERLERGQATEIIDTYAHDKELSELEQEIQDIEARTINITLVDNT